MDLLNKISEAVREVIGSGPDARNIDGRIMMIMVEAGIFSLVRAASKSLFHIYLDDPGQKKIECLKHVRNESGMGLKEAKDLMDRVCERSRPEIFKTVETLGEALRIRDLVASSGATVSIREEVLVD